MPEVQTAEQRKSNKRVLKGSPRTLPGKPKGDKDSPEVKRYVRKVSDLDNPEEVCETILARARYASDYRAAWEEEWRQAIRAWFQRATEDREDGWESDRYLPIIFKHVETAIPSLVAATLDGRRIWHLQANTRKGMEIAKAQERLLNWQAYTVAKAEEAIEDMYWWASIIGTAYIDTGWDWRVETRPWPKVRTIKDPDTGEDTGSVVKEITEQEVTVADHPFMRCLNPLDVFPSPQNEMGSEGEWFVERVRTTIGELREAAGEGHIDGDALEAWIEEDRPWEKTLDDDSDWFQGITGYDWDEWLREMGYVGREDVYEQRSSDFVTADKVVTVLRYRSKQEIVTLGGPSRIIGYSLNPYIHGKTGIVIHHFFKVPGSPFGRGVGTVLLDHQALANENINRWMDTAAVEAAAPIIVDRAAVSILDDEWVFEPNKIIRARGTEAVKRMDVPAPTNLAMLLDQHLQTDADDVTGFSEQARGAAPPASQTATAFSGLQNNLRTRLVLHVRRSARTIRELGDLLLALNQQFLTEPQIVTFTGEYGLDYVEIQPEEIVARSVVRATLNASRAAPELRAQRLVQLTQIALPLLAQGAQQNPTVHRWLRMLLDENEIDEADLILPRLPGSAQDPLLENEALKVGARTKAHPAENHMQHIQAHGALLQELQAAGLVGYAAIVQEHIQEHLAIAQAMAQQQVQAQGGGQPSAPGADPGGNTPAEQEGGATAGGAQRNGTPGVASPGPGAPPGRPV